MSPAQRLAALLCAGLLALPTAAAWPQSDLQDSEPAVDANPPADVQGTPDERTAASRFERMRMGAAVVQAGAVEAAHYVLGPGDVLELDLWGRLSQTALLTVSPEGTIFLPAGGPLSVSGRTLAWARQRVLDLVARSFRGVHAEVRLIQLRTFKVYLTGFVARPGAVVVTSIARASEAVAGVGLAEGGSRRNIEIRRRDGTKLRVDLQLFEAVGRQDLDPTLVDGDVIYVPRGTRFIGASGALERPGRYELAPGDSLSRLLELGGGLLPSAAPDRALMVRFTSPSVRESVTVDLVALTAGKLDLPLRDGDQLFVQFLSDYHVLPVVAVYGEVDRPGAYPIVKGRDRLSDAIGWTGGFLPLANRSAIHLVRESAVGSDKDPEFDRLVRLSRSEMTASEYVKFQTKLAERKNSFRVDWTRIQKSSLDVDPLLQDGDIIRVEQLVPTVRVEGEVRRPGLVDYAPGRTLKEYVELSGGYTDRAARSDVRISRFLTGQVLPARSLGSVQPGDFVWVPERKDVDAWSVFRDAVAVVSQVAVVVFTLSR